MKEFILLMHLMIWDTEMDMYRGITFFEPDIPKYKTVKECQQKGMEIIGKSIIQLNRNQIKTGEWEVNCLEVKGKKEITTNWIKNKKLNAII